MAFVARKVWTRTLPGMPVLQMVRRRIPARPGRAASAGGSSRSLEQLRCGFSFWEWDRPPGLSTHGIGLSRDRPGGLSYQRLQQTVKAAPADLQPLKRGAFFALALVGMTILFEMAPRFYRAPSGGLEPSVDRRAAPDAALAFGSVGLNQQSEEHQPLFVVQGDAKETQRQVVRQNTDEGIRNGQVRGCQQQGQA